MHIVPKERASRPRRMLRRIPQKSAAALRHGP
nr:MAG TPA: hypothetical protein [Caudoviricetes sp.]